MQTLFCSDVDISFCRQEVILPYSPVLRASWNACHLCYAEVIAYRQRALAELLWRECTAGGGKVCQHKHQRRAAERAAVHRCGAGLALRPPVQCPGLAADIRGRRCAARRPTFSASSSARAQHSLRSRWSHAGTCRASHGCSSLILVHITRACQ